MRYYLPLLFILSACQSLKYPWHSSKFNGVIMTCLNDSSSVTIAPIIKIEKNIDSKKGCLNCKYKGCDNVPEYYDFLYHWPGSIGLNFNKQSWYFMTNSRPTNPAIKYGEKGFTVSYDVDGGIMDYDKKNKTLTLVFEKYDMERTFISNYSKSDRVLTLKEINLKDTGKTAFTVGTRQLKKIDAKISFTNLLENGKPKTDLSQMEVQSDTAVIAYIQWKGLTPIKKHYVTIDWLDSQNKVFDQNDYYLRSKNGSYYIWFKTYFKKDKFPAGQIKARIHIDNAFVKEAIIFLK